MPKCRKCNRPMRALTGITVGNPLVKEFIWILYKCSECDLLKTEYEERIPARILGQSV